MISLAPSHALTQVVFVHDYIQLVFDDQIFSFYGLVGLVVNGGQLCRHEVGFCDKLVELVGQVVRTVYALKDDELELVFESGTVVAVREGSSPETWMMTRRDTIVVGR